MSKRSFDFDKDPELSYEIDLMLSAIKDAFASNKDRSWFSLAGACKQFIGVADVKLVLERLGFDGDPSTDLRFIRLIGKQLRGDGMYVTPRVWLNGKLQTTVWRSHKAMLDFYRERNAIDSGTRNNPAKTEFDAKHEWRMK